MCIGISFKTFYLFLRTKGLALFPMCISIIAWYLNFVLQWERLWCAAESMTKTCAFSLGERDSWYCFTAAEFVFKFCLKKHSACFLIWAGVRVLITLAICAPLGARAYPWILSKYFLCVRACVRPCVCPTTDKRRVCILCVKLFICVVF